MSSYYYEEGNVQFKLSREFNGYTSNSELTEDSATEIIALIKGFEDQIQTELDKVYSQLSDVYLKPLRRKIPFTGQKMVWNLNQVSLSQSK